MSTVETQSFHGTAELSAFLKSRREPEWMKSVRRKAYEKFQVMDWPTTRDEEWRRSDISNYDFDSYTYGDSSMPEGGPASAETGIAGTLRFEGTACVEATLRQDLVGRGVVFAPLGTLLAALADGNAPAKGTQSAAATAALEKLFGIAVEEVDNRIRAWHYAAVSHGAYLYVPEFVEIAEPFLIRYHESGDSRLSAPHTAIVLASGARASVVQTVSGADDGELLFNDGSDVSVGDAAHLRYLSSQNLNLDCSVFSNGGSHVSRDATYEHFAGVFGGMFAKNRYDCTLDGPGADVHLNGIYFGHADQHMDVRTVQHHNAPNAASRTNYRGAVKDEAHAVYQGLIQVAHDAVRTDAFLEDKNLILNDGARADSIPSLQINTDDVKCSHGSTTGRLDKNQVFYLMARGYDRSAAEELLVEGFFGNIIDRAPEASRDELRDVIMRRLLVETEA